MRKYDVLGSQPVSVIFLEEDDYQFIIYKEYSDNKNVLMYYSIAGEEFQNNPYWVHVPSFAIRFETYEEAKRLADLMHAKVGIYHEEKKY